MTVKKWHCTECKKLKRSIQPGDVVVCTNACPTLLEQGGIYEVLTVISTREGENGATARYLILWDNDGYVGGADFEWDVARFEVVGNVR